MNARTSDGSPALHLRLSLCWVLIYLCGGVLLELGLALRWHVLSVDELGRDLIRLGHTHGGIAALVNLGVALAQLHLRVPPNWSRPIALCGSCGAAGIGAGFVGAAWGHGPLDPGPLVLLVPAGALCLICAVLAVLLLGRPSSE